MRRGRLFQLIAETFLTRFVTNSHVKPAGHVEFNRLPAVCHSIAETFLTRFVMKSHAKLAGHTEFNRSPVTSTQVRHGAPFVCRTR